MTTSSSQRTEVSSSLWRASRVMSCPPPPTQGSTGTSRPSCGLYLTFLYPMRDSILPSLSTTWSHVRTRGCHGSAGGTATASASGTP
ncbi:unnamed protein product [Coregonus sp. 'balchen']|nr:unnamed protein product [Coregonus sp. 'balchen']